MTRRSLIAPAAMIFDFDLTLVDSRRGFSASHAYAAEQMKVPPPSLDAITRAIGIPIHKVIPGVYPEMSEAWVAEYIRFYRLKADEVMADLTDVLPGAKEALDELRDAGLKLALVSQKLRSLIATVLEREGMPFDVVLGGEDVPDFKPSPSGLQMALSQLGLEVDDAIYVGDTTIDAEAAANAGMRFVGVLTGVTTRDDFAAFDSLAVLDRVGELPAFLGV